MLAYEQRASQLVSAMQALVLAYEQQEGVEDAIMNVQIAADMYRSAQWAWCKQQYSGVSALLDNFGGLKPERRRAFSDKYERDGKMPLSEQSAMLKSAWAEGKKEHVRLGEEIQRRGWVTEDGTVPMGVEEAKEAILREEAAWKKPARNRSSEKGRKDKGVIAWVADRFRRK